MVIGTDIKKFSRPEKTKEWIRKKIWPSLDDAAQALYDNAKNKETVELKISPYIYSYFRKAITIGVIAGAILYFNSCNDKKPQKEEYNKFINYVSIQK